MAQKHSIDSKEYPMTREGRIQGPSRRYRRLRHPSFAAGTWTAKNPLLQRGEIGYEIDTHKVKIGDGVTYWNDLAYIDASGGTWGDITGDINDQTDLKDALDGLQDNIDGKVSKTGDTMSGALTFTNATGAGGIFGYTNGVVFFYMDGDTRTQLAALNPVGFEPYDDNTMWLGALNHRWKEAYITTAYISAINNGYYDLAVPATTGADTLALKSEVDGKVSIDGSSTMTGVLKMRATSSFQCAIAPFWDGVGFYKLNNDDSVTLIASIETPDGFVPWDTNTYNIGSSLKKWKNLYLGGKLFVSTINNGGDLSVPANTTGTLATKADVDLAANSGRMITDQGVWYAKMDALGTIPASAEVEGRNYADFTQVDGSGDPIIVIYTYTSGAWVQTTTITPPSAYDGYVPITSKIWDIPEQTGQQGGRILWNHTSKDFTPYPMIVSFDGASITNSTFTSGTISNSTFDGSADLSGTSTVTMPVSPSSTQIVNKNYVDTAIAGAQSNMPLSVDVTFDPLDANAPTITSDGRIIPNITASHAIIPGWLALDQCEIVLAFEGQTANTIILTAQPGNNTNSFELTLSSGNLLKLNGVDGVTTIDPAQKYYAKITRVGTTCTLSLSTDGTVFTTECTTTISSLLTTKYRIQTTVGASLYCAECYIVNNGIKIWQGVGSPGLHQRVETGHEVIAFQAPTSGNNYTWYRKYADGWVEQGGTISTGGSGNHTVTLLIEMADTDYRPMATRISGASTTTNVNVWARTPSSTTSFVVYAAADTSVVWEVKGMAA